MDLGSSTVTIAHLSDPHLGAHSTAELRSLPEDVAAAGPTVTVLTGDLTMRARPGQFRLARALLDRLPRPLLVVIGNHDLPLGNPLARLARPYQGYRAYLAEDLDPVVAAPGVLVCGLNSAAPWRWKQGRVTRRQLTGLAGSFRAAPVAGLRVVALHHPLSQRGVGRLAGRSRLLAELGRAGVDLVLAGHTHRPAARRVAVPDGGGPTSLVEVVASTATSARTRGAGCSWTVVQADAATFTVEHREYRGAGWAGGERLTFARNGIRSGPGRGS